MKRLWINASPATDFGVSCYSVAGRVFAWKKVAAVECFGHSFFCG